MLNAFLNLVFPVDCIVCGARVAEWTSGALCRDCEGQLAPQPPPFCARCGLPAPSIEDLCGPCLRDDTAYELGRSALVLDERLRQVIHHFKYNDRVSLARPLARALRACLDREPFMAEVIVPVPLHRARERERGYNQAYLLAERLDRRVDPGLVRRRKPTASQTGLTRAQRADNVRNAFHCRRAVAGTVLVLDDVQTTGATVNAVARALRRAGASRIEVLTLARAAPPDRAGRDDPRNANSSGPTAGGQERTADGTD